ncbi:MAG: hypothetical protein ACXACD_14135 [Candidatus Thorarchaeota archaeon]|jgi:uncharacterized damage-inducible protein DinB
MGLKEFAIDTLDIAEWNVLRAILRLKPGYLEYQITPKLNPIQWILGHLTWQMDRIFNQLCQGESKLNPVWNSFATGAERMNQKEFPLAQRTLIDSFLEVSQASFEYLQNLPEEKFLELPEQNSGSNTETLCELIQRISLHFLGHTGQIYWIKKELGKGGYFVTGIKKKQRDDSRIKWHKWWNENKKNYA